ncbi:MAG: hypothetical protein QOH35_262 [Acidobacteriaceae bacterium]|jgi:hypothetical protein|nr:hypothetical protein [Acidobacteriaceae bacterium]
MKTMLISILPSLVPAFAWGQANLGLHASFLMYTGLTTWQTGPRIILAKRSSIPALCISH